MNPIRIYLGDDEVWRSPSADSPYFPSETVAAGALVQSSSTQLTYATGDRIDLSRAANVRETASLTGRLIGINLPGWRGTIASGPTAGPNGTNWYLVEFDRGMWNGYVLDDNFTPLPADAEIRRTPGYFQVGDTIKLFRDSYARTNQNFNSTASVIKVIPENTGGTIIEGPNRDSTDALWYRIEFNDDDETTGWMVSDNYLPGYSAPAFTGEAYWKPYVHIGNQTGNANAPRGPFPDLRGQGGYNFQFWIGGDVCPHDRNWVVQMMDVHSVRLTGNAKDSHPFYHVPECKGCTSRRGVAAKWDPEIPGRIVVACAQHGAGENGGREEGGLFVTTDYAQNFKQVAGYNPSRWGSNAFSLVGGQGRWNLNFRSWHQTMAYKKNNYNHWIYVNQRFNGTNEGGDVLVSYDRGENWTRVVDRANGVNNYIRTRGLSRIFAVDSDANGRWYFGSAEGIHSSDDGINWTVSRANLPNEHVLGLQCHPTNANIAYVAVRDRGVWRTTNRFQSFQKITANADDNAVCNVFAAPYDFNKLYYMTYNRSRNGGDTGKRPKVCFNGLAANPTWQQIRLQTNSYGWYKPNSNGSAPGLSNEEYQAAFMWIEGNHALLTANAQWHSTDDGITFPRSENGSDNLGSGDMNNQPLAVDPKNWQRMAWTAFDTGHVITSNAGDESFRNAHGRFAGAPGNSQSGSGVASFSPDDPNRYVVTTGGYSYYGARITYNLFTGTPSWHDLPIVRLDTYSNGLPIHKYIAYSPVSGSIIYSDHYVCRTANNSLDHVLNGANWVNIQNSPGWPGGRDAQIFGASYQNAETCVALDNGGTAIYRSTNAGRSWTRYVGGISRQQLSSGRTRGPQIDPRDDRRVWWFENGAGLRCFDGNRTWTAGQQFGQYGPDCQAVVVSHQTDGLAYAMLRSSGRGGVLRVMDMFTSNPKAELLEKYCPLTLGMRGLAIHPQSDLLFLTGTVGTKYHEPPTINAVCRQFLDKIATRQARMNTEWRRATYGV